LAKSRGQLPLRIAPEKRLWIHGVIGGQKPQIRNGRPGHHPEPPYSLFNQDRATPLNHERNECEALAT
jgi:hypothetical protein